MALPFATQDLLRRSDAALARFKMARACGDPAELADARRSLEAVRAALERCAAISETQAIKKITEALHRPFQLGALAKPAVAKRP
jgi:hypothetical protein